MTIEATPAIISDDEALEMIDKLAKWTDRQLDVLYPGVDGNTFALMQLYRATKDARLNLKVCVERDR